AQRQAGLSADGVADAAPQARDVSDRAPAHHRPRHSASGSGAAQRDTDGARGGESQGIMLFSVAGQPEGPTLQLAEYEPDGKTKAALLSSDTVGGPVV